MSNSGFVQITPRVRAGDSIPPGVLTRAGSPIVPQFHLFEADAGRYLLLANGSQIFEVGDDVYADLDRARERGRGGHIDALLEGLGFDPTPFIDDEVPESFPVRSLSLAIAQKCNLGCTYCYAQEGNFGSASKDMSPQVAMNSVDLLFSEAGPGETVNLSFLGGEPLTNRDLLRTCTERAVALGGTKGIPVNFSITTNGTLVRPDDAEFFERHKFAVTVSLDGVREVHDRLRPLKSGSGSYDRVLANVRPLIEAQRNMQVSARVTVTPENLALRETLDEFIGLGFHSVGFSPMLSSPTGRGEMNARELDIMLGQMISCGEEFERQVAMGARYPFMNMVNALKEIHKGTHRPYPCGAGAGYLGVSAEGGLYACHRFVEDEDGAMGSVAGGVDRARQKEWLAARHVHFQEPCNGCWARYLCGGGCHHEVIKRGRPACDYIRGWLHYSLQAYIRLSEKRPDYFGNRKPPRTALHKN
jgi:uncharacterized protein